MFRTKCATISPTWALSCQRSTTFAAHPLDYVQFRANGSHHRSEPTGLYRRSNRHLAWSETVISVEVVYASATRRLKHSVGVRHEVVQVAVVIVVSLGLTAIRRDTTRSSATGILPGRASLVTAGCEAPGTSVSFIPPSSMQPVERQGWQRLREEAVATASTKVVEGSDCVVWSTYVNR
jgi:hypothetical protein